MTPFAWWFSLLLLALQQARDLEPGAQFGSSELAGLVISMDAATPLRGAIVTASVGGVSRAAITDEAGRFLFREFPAGRVLVSARRPGFVTMFFGAKQPGQPGVPVVVGPKEQASGLRIALPRGAVITGTIRDSHGAPAQHTPVGTLRVGSSPTGGPAPPVPTVVSDDRGMYRLFDLAPGDYVVVALPPYNLAPGGVGVRPAGEIDAIFQRLQQRSRGAGPAQPALRPVELSQTFTYVPIYYPGSAVAAEAERIRVGAGEERHGVDFTVRLVRTVTISGAVTHPSGTVPDVTLSITPDEPYGRAQVFPIGGSGLALSVRPGPDGRFEYTNVPPGRYTITARTPRDFDIFCGMAEVTVTNEDVSGVGLALQPGLRVIGRVVLDREPGAASGLDLTWTQVTVRRSGLSYNVSNGTTMGIASSGASLVGPDGTFEVAGLLPGDYQIAVSTTAPGAWRLQSATIGARDLLDGFAIALNHATGVVLTMSNRHTVFEGKFHAPAGSVAADYFLVVFPGDRALWRAGSRRVQFTRPSTNGDFVLRDLPAGQYRVAAMTDVDPDQLTNLAFLEQALASSIPIGLIDGQTVRQDLKVGR